MLTRRNLFLAGATGIAALSVTRLERPYAAKAANNYEVTHTDAEWRKLLTPDAYDVLRKEGTERPFTSPLLNEHRAGTFTCDGCDLPLYSSKTKYDSGTGWPSFWAPIAKENVTEETDTSLGMMRTEALCSKCNAHLGHVFPDGPQPTGLRYCMNSASLQFVKKEAPK